MSAPVIENMEERHIPALAELERRCFSCPWSENSLRAELSKPEAVFFVASEDGVVSGYLGAHRVLDEVYVANIAVLPEKRRHRIAETLLLKLCAQARAGGCSFVTLEVRVSNTAARALYEKCGFVIAGRRKNFYEKPVEDGLIYTLNFK